MIFYNFISSFWLLFPFSRFCSFFLLSFFIPTRLISLSFTWRLTLSFSRLWFSFTHSSFNRTLERLRYRMFKTCLECESERLERWREWSGRLWESVNVCVYSWRKLKLKVRERESERVKGKLIRYTSVGEDEIFAKSKAETIADLYKESDHVNRLLIIDWKRKVCESELVFACMRVYVCVSVREFVSMKARFHLVILRL